MQMPPALQTRNTGYGKSLSTSLVVAVCGTTSIFSALALIVQIHRVMTEVQAVPKAIVTTYVEPVRKKSKPKANLAPERMITVSSGPSFAQMKPVLPVQEQPEFTKAPEPEQTSTELLVLEELDFENPFEEKAEPATPRPKAKASPLVAGKTTPAKQSGPSQAELERRERARLAGLAKKVIQQASVLSRSTPHYPKSARRKGLQGRVIVTVTVGTSGKVSSCQISQSSGHSTLDQSAVSAARRYRFRPAKNGLGQAVSVRKAIPFNFQLTS
jgi:protein TonB